MKAYTTTAGFILAVSLFSFTTTGASAYSYQEQSQSSSNSYSFSSSCDGSNCGEVSFKSKSKLKQSQSQSTNYTQSDTHYRSRNGWSKPNQLPKYGSFTLGWDHRGGTCHVRYSESNVQSYKYSTSAACDAGEVVVGGLQRGSTYRFQVKKDDGAWSAPLWLRAN
ncbi:MAG: hypothetical protein QG639_940 [Patescibacteria group bacterium]|nr:hypothetical protein [Patescibacteria group bacterium]